MASNSLNSLFLLVVVLLCLEVNAKTFSVIYNTIDPAIYGTKGGATLEAAATGDDYVNAFTICIRFQGGNSKISGKTMWEYECNMFYRASIMHIHKVFGFLAPLPLVRKSMQPSLLRFITSTCPPMPLPLPPQRGQRKPLMALWGRK